LRGGLTVSVHLPLRNEAELDDLIARQAEKSSADYHHFLTPQQFRERYAPPAADLVAAAASLRELGFDARVTSQSVFAAAPQAVVEHAFGIHVRQVAQRGRAGLSVDRAPLLPQALTKLGATVSVARFAKHVNSKQVAKVPYGDTRPTATPPSARTGSPTSNKPTATRPIRARTAPGAASAW
jgi:xanthomonalisin